MNNELNKQRDSFDEAFMQVFAHAEEDPRPEVWDKIESRLEKKRSFLLGKRLRFFQMIAATMGLLFAASISLWLQPFGSFFNQNDGAIADSGLENHTPLSSGNEQAYVSSDTNIDLMQEEMESKSAPTSNSSRVESKPNEATSMPGKGTTASTLATNSRGAATMVPAKDASNQSGSHNPLDYLKHISEVQALTALDYDFESLADPDFSNSFMKKVDLWDLVYAKEEESAKQNKTSNGIQAGLLASSGLFSPNFRSGMMMEEASTFRLSSNNGGFDAQQKSVEKNQVPISHLLWALVPISN